MKKATLQVAPKPKSFADVKFTQADWEKAKAAGPFECNFVTAIENLKLSKGLYVLKEEKPEVTIRAMISPDEMTNAELNQQMVAFGKPPRKKMSREKAVEFVKKLIAESESMIVDDEGDDE